MSKTIGAGPTEQDKALSAALDSADVMGGEFWSPEVKGDTIVGEILLDEMSEGQYGVQRVLSLAVGNDVILVSVNQSLARELARQQAKIGNRVGIQFKGKVKTKAGRDFNTFVARVVK